MCWTRRTKMTCSKCSKNVDSGGKVLFRSRGWSQDREDVDQGDRQGIYTSVHPFHSTACAAPFLRYEGLVSFLFFVCFHCAICLFSPACADALWSLFPLSQRKWSEEEKRRHSSACIAKDRLTLAQKIEIIRLHESEDYRERKSQTALASMFEVLTMIAITITRRRMNSKLQCVRLWHFIIPFVFTLQLA